MLIFKQSLYKWLLGLVLGISLLTTNQVYGAISGPGAGGIGGNCDFGKPGDYICFSDNTVYHCMALPGTGYDWYKVVDCDDYQGDCYVYRFGRPYGCKAWYGKCNSPPSGSGYCSISTVRGYTLCDAGSDSSVTDEGSYFQWKCSGTKSTATCKADDLPVKTGVCGGANGKSYCSTPDLKDAQMCSVGSVKNLTSIYTTGSSGSIDGWSWRCSGVCTSSTAYYSETCTANDIDPITGVCGGANGVVYDSEPSSDTLCTSGTHSIVTHHDSDPGVSHVGTYYSTSSNCTKQGVGSYCASFSGSPAAGSTCKVTGAFSVDYGKIVTGQCPGSSSIRCCVPATLPYSANTYTWTCTGQCGGANASCTTGACEAANGGDGVCGDANNQVYSSTPPEESLCNTGYGVEWVDQSGAFGTYRWNCLGDDGYCGGNSGASDSCSALEELAPWWQAVGGSVIGKNEVVDSIPVTCQNVSGCKPSVSIDGVGNTEGIVAVGGSASCGSDDSNCQYGLSGDDPIIADLTNSNYDYKYFYNNYFVKLGQGTTLNGDQDWKNVVAQVGNTGVVLVDGNLTIGGSFQLSSGFLMIVASGSINIKSDVNKFNGILVGKSVNTVVNDDGDMNSSQQLVIKGIVYAYGINDGHSGDSSVNFSRGYESKSDNNGAPAAVVNYDPSLIFNMPKDLARVLSEWKSGI